MSSTSNSGSAARYTSNRSTQRHGGAAMTRRTVSTAPLPSRRTWSTGGRRRPPSKRSTGVTGADNGPGLVNARAASTTEARTAGSTWVVTVAALSPRAACLTVSASQAPSVTSLSIWVSARLAVDGVSLRGSNGHPASLPDR